VYAVFTAFTVICIFPFYYILINTISNNDLSATGHVIWYPRGVHLENYIRIFNLPGLGQAAWVTLARTGIGTVTNVICTAFVAFALSKRDLWKRKFWYRYFIVTMYFNAGIIPNYINMQNLGLTDNFLLYIIGVVSVFHLILVKTYIESIPESLQESAEMDGAGYLTVFARIVFPLCTPILATIAVFTAIGHWNDFYTTLVYMRSSKLFTLQYKLWEYLNEANAVAAQMRSSEQSGVIFAPELRRRYTPMAVRMTITMVVTLPILVVYPFFQRFFVKGIMIGAIKG